LSEKEKEAKLFKAIEEDEQLVEKEIQELTGLANVRLNLQVRIPGSAKVVSVKARQLKDTEVLSYLREQTKISPDLAKAEQAEDVELTADQQEKLYALMDRYISLATGISEERLREIGNIRIRSALMIGLLKGSVPDKKEIEEIQKFRPTA